SFQGQGDQRAGWPAIDAINRAMKEMTGQQDSETAKETLLFHLLAGDSRIRTLITQFEGQPTELQGAATRIWDTSAEPEDIEAHTRGLILLVDLASRARLASDQPPLLAARYHYFVRSLEGLSICLATSCENNGSSRQLRLLLGRHSEVPDAPDGSA